MRESDFIVLDDGDIYPRNKVPQNAICICSACREYEGQKVALVKGADWVTFREDVINRRRHHPLIPVEQATDLAWWLYQKQDKAVFVETDLFGAS